MAVPVNSTGTASVEAMKAPPVPGPERAKTSLLDRKTVPGLSHGSAREEGKRGSDQRLLVLTYECQCTEAQCKVQRVQPDRGHHCGRRRNKRYNSTSLLAVT